MPVLCFPNWPQVPQIWTKFDTQFSHNVWMIMRNCMTPARRWHAVTEAAAAACVSNSDSYATYSLTAEISSRCPAV